MYNFVLALTLTVASVARDSSNIRMTEMWPFGPAYSVQADTLRDIIFLSSGSGVFTIVNDSAVYDGIKTDGNEVVEMIYDYNSQKLYTGCLDGTIEMWLTSDPDNPTRLASYHRDSRLHLMGMKLYGDRLLAAFGDDSGRLEILSRTDLSEVASVSFPYGTRSIDISGNILFVQYLVDSMSAYDITDVDNPILINTFGSEHGTFGGGKIVARDTLVFVAYGGIWNGGFGVINVADIMNPTIIATRSSNLLAFNRVRLYGNSLYLMGVWLERWDITDPANPEPGWFYSVQNDGIYDVLFYHGTPITAASTGGLSVIGFDTTGTPFEASYYRTPGYSMAVYQRNGYIYYLSRILGQRYMVSVVSGGHLVNNFIIPADPGGSRLASAMDGDLMFVLIDTALYAVDLSDPRAPALAGTLVLPPSSFAYFGEIIAADSMVYITANSGVLAVSASDPSNMYVADSLFNDDFYSLSQMAIVSHYLYVTAPYKIIVIDITDPSSLQLAGVADVPQAWAAFSAMAVYNNHIYLATEAYQLLVMDINDPVNPVFDTTMSFSEYTYFYRLAADNNTLFAGTWSYPYDILLAFDISDPTNPVQRGFYEVPSIERNHRFDAIDVDGNTVCIANYDIGVRELVYTLTGIQEGIEPTASFLSVDGRIKFSMKRAGYVDVRIYNSAGRTVFSSTKWLDSGNHEIVPALPNSGVYFYTVKTADKLVRGKLLSVR